MEEELTLIEKIQNDLVEYVSGFYQEMQWYLESDEIADHYINLGNHITYIRSLDSFQKFINEWQNSGLVNELPFQAYSEEEVTEYLRRILESN